MHSAMIRLYGEIAFLICCFLGFLFQVYHISAIYFAYSTNSRVQRTVHISHTTPDAAICVEFAEVLDWDSYRLVYKDPDRLPTTNDIFRFTPAIDEIIKSSFHRERSGFRIIRTNDSHRFFFVKKFFVSSSICYAFGLINNPEIYYPTVSLSLQEKNTFFGIQLSDKLTLVTKFSAMVYYGGLPYTSKNFCPTVDRTAAGSTSMMSEYAFSFIRNGVSLLQTPYDTGCTEGSGKKTRCQMDCMTERLAPIDRVPYQIVAEEGSDRPPFNQQDMEEEDKLKIIEESFQYCNSLCIEVPCKYDYTTTTLAGEKHTAVTGNKSSIWIRVEAPSAPGLNIVTDPKICLTEYLIYVCSSFGIWFGLSVYNLNPLRLISMRVRRCCCQDEEPAAAAEPSGRSEMRARVLSMASITIIVERSTPLRRACIDPIAGCI